MRRLAAAGLMATVPAVAAAASGQQSLPVAGASVSGVLLSLVLVLALIVGLAWVLRRLQAVRSGGPHAMQVVAQLPLGPRERVVLIQVGDRQALVGVAPAGVTSLQLLEVGAVPVATGSTMTGISSDPSALIGRMRDLMERGRGR